MKQYLILVNRYFTHIQSLRESDQFGRLAFEISCVLIIKVMLLWLLWSLCFSQPVEKNDRQEAVTRMMLNKP